MEEQASHTMADYAAARVLVAAADKGYRSMEVFVAWFTAGTAAALGLAAANVDKLHPLVSIGDIRSALPMLGAILVLVLGSRLFGSVICTLAATMQAGGELFRDSNELGQMEIDRAEFLAAIERSTPWPVRRVQKLWRWGRRGAPANFGKTAIWLLMASNGSAIVAAALTVLLWFKLLG